MSNETRTDLMAYLPEYLKKYCELEAIMQTENMELENIKMQHTQVIDDRFVISCGIYGVLRFEKMLGITPLLDDSLETRKFRILSKQSVSIP